MSKMQWIPKKKSRPMANFIEMRPYVEPMLAEEFKKHLKFLENEMTERLRCFDGCKNNKVKVMWAVEVTARDFERYEKSKRKSGK